MITVERFLWVMSGMHVFTAGFITAGHKLFKMRWVCGRDVIGRIGVMMVEIDRELEIVGHAIFELLAKIDNAVGPMRLLPARCNPLFKFAVTFRRKVGCVSPRKGRFVPVPGRNAKQSRGRKD